MRFKKYNYEFNRKVLRRISGMIANETQFLNYSHKLLDDFHQQLPDGKITLETILRYYDGEVNDSHLSQIKTWYMIIEAIREAVMTEFKIYPSQIEFYLNHYFEKKGISYYQKFVGLVKYLTSVPLHGIHKDGRLTSNTNEIVLSYRGQNTVDKLRASKRLATNPWRLFYSGSKALLYRRDKNINPSFWEVPLPNIQPLAIVVLQDDGSFKMDEIPFENLSYINIRSTQIDPHGIGDQQLKNYDRYYISNIAKGSTIRKDANSVVSMRDLFPPNIDY